MSLPAAVLTEDQQQLACELAAKGMMIKQIKCQLGIASSTWYAIVKRYPQFEIAFNHARTYGFLEIAEAVREIPEQYLDPQAGRLALECTKTYLGWMDPRKYGNKIDVHVTQELDLGAIIAASNERLERVVHQVEETIW